MRITKVYTRSGDEGQTRLGSGERVSKASLRVCAYGDVDELNSVLGFARTRIGTPDEQSLLERIQNELFVLGADLAVPLPQSPEADRQRRISVADVETLEVTIDHYNDALPALLEFILPAGNEAGTLLHVARAVARRAERTVVRLAEAERVNAQVIVYLNRLSDLLFVLARWANRQDGSSEVFAQFH